jgi:hypothetical protein
MRRHLPFVTTVSAIACALVTAWGPAAHASQLTGYDVSYPQCTQALPSGQTFGIVAVNEGLPNNTNPCLADEISWAQLSSGASNSGASKQPKASLYVNTADPGNHGITDWPVNNTDPLYGYQVWDPYGTCRGGNGQACAWLYGRNMAELDAKTRGVQNPGSYRWWLDVETLNSWEDNDPGNNRADLEGMAAYFLHIGARVGLYSTPKQFQPLTGTVKPGSPLYRLPDWIPGAKTLAQAKKNCRMAPLTAGGKVTVTQWKTKPANSDFSCPPA